MLQTVVASAAADPALLAWELGNELKLPSDPGLFANFVAEAAKAVRIIDPDHLLAVGLISAASAGLSWDQATALYANPDIDLLSTHNYDGGGDDNLALAAAVGKPLIFEEAGFSGADRGAKVDADLANWLGKGARGYMQWGFMPANTDTGDGDATFGLDHVLGTHPADWQALHDAFAAWSTKRQTP